MKYVKWIIRLLFLVLFVLLIRQDKLMLWLGLFGGSLILAVLLGRVYCGYICPMNTVMIPLDGLLRKLSLTRRTTPNGLMSGRTAWIALIVSVGVMLFSRAVLQRNLPILMLWLVLSVLVTLWFHPAVFHTSLCPFSPLQKLFGRSPFFSHEVDQSRCIGCKKCEKACPSQAIRVERTNKKAAIAPAACFQCNGCQEVCPAGAISYGRKGPVAAKALDEDAS